MSFLIEMKLRRKDEATVHERVELNVVSLYQVTGSNCFLYPEKAALLHTLFCSLTPRRAQGLIVLDYIDSLLILRSPSARQKGLRCRTKRQE